jgi:hypothetical protein
VAVVAAAEMVLKVLADQEDQAVVAAGIMLRRLAGLAIHLQHLRLKAITAAIILALMPRKWAAVAAVLEQSGGMLQAGKRVQAVQDLLAALTVQLPITQAVAVAAQQLLAP